MVIMNSIHAGIVLHTPQFLPIEPPKLLADFVAMQELKKRHDERSERAKTVESTLRLPKKAPKQLTDATLEVTRLVTYKHKLESGESLKELKDIMN